VQSTGCDLAGDADAAIGQEEREAAVDGAAVRQHTDAQETAEARLGVEEVEVERLVPQRIVAARMAELVPRSDVAHANAASARATTPRSASTVMTSPVRNAVVAPVAATTAGMPYSLAMTEPCESMPPTSTTMAAALRKSGVQARSVTGATRISPGL